jgi:hypothetical protein
LTISNFGVATLSGALSFEGNGTVSGSGVVSFPDFTLQVKNFGCNTGAFGSFTLNGRQMYVILQNTKAQPRKISSTSGTYAFMALGDIDYGFLSRVGSGLGKIWTAGHGHSLKSLWLASVSIAHAHVLLGGTVSKSGVFLITKPWLYTGGKLFITPYAVGKTYIGFKGYLIDRNNGLDLSLIGVRSQ